MTETESRRSRLRAVALDVKNTLKWRGEAVARGYATGRGRAERKAVQAWKDRYPGQRCVIMGNGPSLNNTDLSLLKGEMVFGLNRIYLMYDRLPIRPQFQVVVNRLVVEQTVDELHELEGPLFTTYPNHGDLATRPDTYFLNPLWTRRFHRDIAQGIWEGMTVTYVAMQVAHYMGFRDVVLIGVDHNFATKGTPHHAVTSHGADPNHFDPNYFGKGFRWQLPDLENSEVAYRLAKRAYEQDGGRIVDSTVGGKLDVFDKVPLAEALGKGRTVL